MPRRWVERPIGREEWSRGADVAVTLDQHLYPALLPIIRRWAREHHVRVAVKEGFGEISRLVPEQAERMVFITAGAFTPWSREFLGKVPNPCVEKPFRLESLQATVSERLGYFAERSH